MSALPPPFLELVARLKEDLASYEGDWTRPGFQALAVHRFGTFRMKVESYALRGPMSVTYRALYRFVRNFYGIELPYTAEVGRRVMIEHQGAIVVHGGSVIGDDTIIRQGVTIGNKTQDKPFDAPIIGKGVNIGAGAKILGKVRVGDGASVGANAVVTRDVAPNIVVGGIPARPLNSVPSRPPRLPRPGED